MRALGREGLFWLLAWFTAALVCVACQGCGASLVTVGARGVDVAGTLLGPAMDSAARARALHLDACETAPMPVACLDAGEAEWAPRIAALNAARDALAAILAGLDAVHAGAPDAPTFEQMVTLAQAALASWSASAAAGNAMPALPADVIALADGVP